MTTHDEEQLDIIRRLYEKEERELKDKLAQKKAKLKAAHTPDPVPGFLSATVKRRTRCLIRFGAYMEHVTRADPDLRGTLLTRGLEGFLERDRGRGAVRSWSRRG